MQGEAADERTSKMPQTETGGATLLSPARTPQADRSSSRVPAAKRALSSRVFREITILNLGGGGFERVDGRNQYG